MSTATGVSKKYQLSTASMDGSTPWRRFEFPEILSATDNFNESLVIGKGFSGTVYKGTVTNGSSISLVAIKRLGAISNELGLLKEVEVLSKFHHRNLVSLFGYCTYEAEMFIVYEYMANGTLEDHLHKLGTPLSWLQRLRICIGAGQGLDYLHAGAAEFPVIHGGVRASNIFLHESCAAKISGFGLSKVVPLTQSFLLASAVGPFRYVDPNYLYTGRLTKESDVYYFGLLLVEVLCPKTAMSLSGLGRRIRDSIKEGNMKDMIDSGIKGQASPNCLEEFVQIAERCLNNHQKKRPTMAEVVISLESVLTLQEKVNSSQLSGQTIVGGSYSRQKVKLLSDKSHEHIGDHGRMSDFVLETIEGASSEESHSLEKGLKQKMWLSNEEITPASEAKRKFEDGESGDQTEPLYEPMNLEYIKLADLLVRKKDLLHLIWLYSVKKEAEVNFVSLVDKFSLLNEYITKSTDSSTNGSYLVELQILLQYIEEHLDAAAFDMDAFLSEGLVENRFGYLGYKNLGTQSNSVEVPLASFWSGIPEVHASAVASATHRAVNCIKDLKVKKLGISGIGAEEIAETLKDLPDLKTGFDMILSVYVKQFGIEKIMNDIEEEIYLWRKRSSKTDSETIVSGQFLNCLLFLHCSDGVIFNWDHPRFNLSERFGITQIVITYESQYAYKPLDMQIRLMDHLLPWILFSTNADLAAKDKYPSIQQMAKRLIEKCDGHLLAIILLARKLRSSIKVRTWKLALRELASPKQKSSSSLGVTGDVMVRVLRFIWNRMETLSQRCIIQYASRYKESKIEKSLLINSWIEDGLVKSEQEGERVFQDLIRSFLLEQVGDNYVRMRDETRVTLIGNFVSRAHALYLKEDGSESNRMPTIEEWDAREIHLSNNIISKLPDDPDCPILVRLFLQGNRYLMHIPITFFNNMPSLQALDLSGTSIKSLPSSISKLTTLQKFFIRDCDLLMELPPEIGALNSLKVFDSEGTQLMRLPEEFRLLTKLERLKLSLYNFPDDHKQNNPSLQSLAIVLSNLIQLKELVVSANSYGKWWEDEVKLIINILPKFQRLESLRLYFPITELLAIFIETHSWRRVPVYQHLSNFGFVVGHLKERLISRVPDDLYKTFVKMPKCLTYTNGEVEGDTKVIASMLTNANALFLDRHWNVRSLSAFGLKEMEQLKLCLLAECNEMLEIVNGSHLDDHSTSRILGSLEHLSIHYMKSLTCILNRPIDSLCMPNLKTLTIHTCSELRAIFTEGLLDSLACLEYLVVEDCKRIKSLVSLESDHLTSSSFLPSLKKISLLDLPELVSISSGIRIAPRLESLVVYDCPNLEELSYIKASGDYMEIKGEREWWDALKWCEPEWPSGQPDYLNFIALGTDGDITDELTDAVNLLPYLGMGESTKEAQTVEIITGPVIHYSSVKSASVKKLSQTPSKWWTTDKGKGKVSIHSRHVESVDDDITDELTDAVNLLPYLGMGESTKEPKQWK